ncbi:hypothetical protein Acr_23g0009710 [Actinidia rufa]|uniref:Uncharacterized protein n=1 Tax=Actinidia rufa TaxID=165716 RepID=A0A7J0GP41_9ERIC|nr:hypothetical protein Acr_23g0009710 [Actinidia rufa]
MVFYFTLFLAYDKTSTSSRPCCVTAGLGCYLVQCLLLPVAAIATPARLLPPTLVAALADMLVLLSGDVAPATLMLLPRAAVVVPMGCCLQRFLTVVVATLVVLLQLYREACVGCNCLLDFFSKF